MNWIEKIQTNVRRQIQERKGSRAWLKSATQFDAGNYFDEESRAISERLFNKLKLAKGYSIEAKKRTFEKLLANLLHAYPQPVAASRNRNEWARPEYNGIKYEISQYINLLHEKGYIDMKRGYNFNNKAEKGKIWPTQKLLSYFPKKKQNIRWKPVNLIELRDSDSRQLKKFEHTDKTDHIHEVLKKANKVNGEADIHYEEYKIKAFLVAIFINDFTLYGRLHTRGYRHYQGLSGRERRGITINGHRVTELDYRALNPYLLYAEAGLQYHKDPYTAVCSNPLARPFLKQILLSMLNSKDFRQAESAANYWLFKNHSKRKELKKIGITKARPLMEAFNEAHKPIAGHFCSGKKTGLEVMNKDASIALGVVEHFTGKSIPILAIHDSFIVESQHSEELRKVMKKVYRKHTKGYRCFVHS
jgi:hypothetical protein